MGNERWELIRGAEEEKIGDVGRKDEEEKAEMEG